MFHGSMVALVTPMHLDAQVDYESLRHLVEMHLEEGTRGIVVSGTTGEAATLSFEEKRRVTHHVVEQVNSRVPVIAGTAASGTQSAIELTQMAWDEGVDACLLMTPAYIKPTQEGLFLHYQQIAASVPVPQILYNVPSRTGCDLLPQTVERLSHISNIVGIKEAVGDMARVRELHELCAERLDIYSGDDMTAMEAMLNGAKGVISVTANVAPKLMSDMSQAALDKDQPLAQTLNEKLKALHRDLFLESNPIPVKWVLHEMGLIPGGIRSPLTPLSSRYHSALRAAMKQAGVFYNDSVTP